MTRRQIALSRLEEAARVAEAFEEQVTKRRAAYLTEADHREALKAATALRQATEQRRAAYLALAKAEKDLEAIDNGE